MTKPRPGDLIETDGAAYKVLTVDRRLTPYRRRNQTTRCEGYTLGLAAVADAPDADG